MCSQLKDYHLKIIVCFSELRERPNDIDLWIELIDMQDILMQQKTDDESNKLFTEQSIHEKKLAIVEQALNKNPSNLKLLVTSSQMLTHIIIFFFGSLLV